MIRKRIIIVGMDIQKMLTAIHVNGLSDYQIAKKISTEDHTVSASIVYRLRKGQHKTTSFQRGQLIQSLYESVVN